VRGSRPAKGARFFVFSSTFRLTGLRDVAQGLRKMITWLASYPRSGSNLLQSILLECFGHKTHSLHDGSSVSSDTRRFFKNAAESDDTYFVKTHNLPQDDAKTIYLVRDGRACIISYLRYLKDFHPEAELSLEDVIMGNCMFGSWSDHFKAWEPRSRPNTLLLRYEDLVREPRKMVHTISDFIGDSVVNSELPELKPIDSNFLGSGNDDSSIAELEGRDLNLFWLMHGQVMIELGYTDNVPAVEVLADRFSSALRHLAGLRRAVVELEADRAERLRGASSLTDAIHGLQGELAISEAERAALRKQLAELNEELAASETILEQGIDFTRPKFPRFVAEVSGLSTAEAFGRWTDGNDVEIRFRHALPRRFTLQLTGWLGWFVRNPYVELRVGAQKNIIRMKPGVPSVCSIGFSNPEGADAISFKIPGAAQPIDPDGGASDDARQLGIALSKLKVLPFHLWWPGSSIRKIHPT
jgi:hypothetical protein